MVVMVIRLYKHKAPCSIGDPVNLGDDADCVVAQVAP